MAAATWSDDVTAEPVRLQALARAQAEIGVHEDPPGSNRGPQVSAWIKRVTALDGGIPWCACFAWCMFDDAGDKLAILGAAAVANWVTWAASKGYHVSRPLRGDVLCYSWHGPDPHPGDHIGFVEKVLALPWPRNGRRFYLRTVEGNTGDAVRRRWRWVNPASVYFIRVP